GVLHDWRHVRVAGVVARSRRADAEDLADHRAHTRRARHPRGSLKAMTLYFFVLQYLHIIGATVLLGTGAGIPVFMVRAHRSRDVFVIAGVARIVVTADFVFTATAVVVQPVTGYLLAKFLGYPIFDGWIGLSLILYGVTGAFWIPVVFMQIRMRNLAE